MSYKIIEHPMSPYAQKIRIMLREKGVAFSCCQPAGVGSGNDPLLEQNPRREVPLLQIDEIHFLYDSSVILEYLEESIPLPSMMPNSALLKAKMRTIERVCDGHYEAINWGLIELSCFRRGGGIEATLKDAALRDISNMHAWLQGQLGSNSWLSGEQFGWGDICAVPHVAVSSMLGVVPTSGTPLDAWWKRCLIRPAVADTIAEASATMPGLADAWQWLEQGFSRQYRDHRLEWMIRSGGLSVVKDGLNRGNIRFTLTEEFAKT
tara:strand:+ start:141414 stop:142205 length:792 start_codon:yes stop_codon:yes gene_type:complete